VLYPDPTEKQLDDAGRVLAGVALEMNTWYAPQISRDANTVGHEATFNAFRAAHGLLATLAVDTPERIERVRHAYHAEIARLIDARK
jgi:hypothetical protein